MAGGLIQLVAYGVQDIFLTRDPQITLFKIVYRRHTNFSTEPQKQYFIHKPDFGKRVTCQIATNGDLIGATTLVITLPKIKEFTNGDSVDTLTKFAWVRKIGFAIINTIEIEIGGTIIDKHFGEWLNIWFELTKEYRNYDKIIGDVEELYTYSNGKDEYTLYIPLQFWFCRSYGLALPLVALHYSEVKINLELNDLDKCMLITPTNYIEVENDIVSFQPFEYIEQNINNTIASGLFTHYDDVTKRLYYSRISRNKFVSMTVTNENSLTPLARRATVYNPSNSKYWIKSLTTNRFVMPRYNSTPQVYSYNKLRNVQLKDCYLLVNYIYLDTDERKKFVTSRHDYVIEQLIYPGEQTIESPNRKVNINVIQPSKLLVWVVQYAYLKDKNNNDHFNYTDNYKYIDNKQIGKSIVKNETILLNSNERLSNRDFNYFNYTQAYQNFKYSIDNGINAYSFGLEPLEIFPTGTCNMSQIDNINIQLNLIKEVNISNQTKFRSYSIGYNICRVINGLLGIVFTR